MSERAYQFSPLAGRAFKSLWVGRNPLLWGIRGRATTVTVHGMRPNMFPRTQRALSEPDSRRRAELGITIIELLIVMAIIGILAGLVAFNGRRMLQGQEERAAITSLQQTVWQGATSAAARGVVVRLTREGQSFFLRESVTGRILKEFELPRGVTTNWPENQDLEFMPPGKVSIASLDALPEPLTITANDTTMRLIVSLIGEVKVEVQ